ncbi:MAG: GntR family transcriptional regulator [Alphaproteobacteria bacterium]|nr:MAG: GntR family transcriptional regulator [Alphaproteobacteria bacterium]
MKGKSGINLDKLVQEQGETAQEWVYRALRFAVMSGQVQPGRALTIRGIADMLGVSAMPVREALRRLTSEGALELKSNRRIMVPDLSPARLAELLELRIVLEVHAAERALPYINDTTLSELHRLNDEQNKAFEALDAEGSILGNQAFHRALYTAHPHPVSLPMIERVWLQLGPLHRLALANLEKHYVTDRHVEIMRAIETRNPFGLKAAIESDIRDGAGYMTQTELLDRYSRAEAGNLAVPGKDFVRTLSKR